MSTTLSISFAGTILAGQSQVDIDYPYQGWMTGGGVTLVIDSIECYTPGTNYIRNNKIMYIVIGNGASLVTPFRIDGTDTGVISRILWKEISPGVYSPSETFNLESPITGLVPLTHTLTLQVFLEDLTTPFIAPDDFIINVTLKQTIDVGGVFYNPATGDLDMGGFKIINMADGVDPMDAVTKQQLDAAVSGGGPVDLGNVNFTNGAANDNFDMGAKLITNLADGVGLTDAVTKQQLDNKFPVPIGDVDFNSGVANGDLDLFGNLVTNTAGIRSASGNNISVFTTGSNNDALITADRNTYVRALNGTTSMIANVGPAIVQGQAGATLDGRNGSVLVSAGIDATVNSYVGNVNLTAPLQSIVIGNNLKVNGATSEMTSVTPNSNIKLNPNGTGSVDLSSKKITNLQPGYSYTDAANVGQITTTPGIPIGNIDFNSGTANGSLNMNINPISNVTYITGSGAVALNAGGTNQNVTLTPTGTGKIDITSKEVVNATKISGNGTSTLTLENTANSTFVTGLGSTLQLAGAASLTTGGQVTVQSGGSNNIILNPSGSGSVDVSSKKITSLSQGTSVDDGINFKQHYVPTPFRDSPYFINPSIKRKRIILSNVAPTIVNIYTVPTGKKAMFYGNIGMMSQGNNGAVHFYLRVPPSTNNLTLTNMRTDAAQGNTWVSPSIVLYSGEQIWCQYGAGANHYLNWDMLEVDTASPIFRYDTFSSTNNEHVWNFPTNFQILGLDFSGTQSSTTGTQKTLRFTINTDGTQRVDIYLKQPSDVGFSTANQIASFTGAKTTLSGYLLNIQYPVQLSEQLRFLVNTANWNTSISEGAPNIAYPYNAFAAFAVTSIPITDISVSYDPLVTVSDKKAKKNFKQLIYEPVRSKNCRERCLSKPYLYEYTDEALQLLPELTTGVKMGVMAQDLKKEFPDMGDGLLWKDPSEGEQYMTVNKENLLFALWAKTNYLAEVLHETELNCKRRWTDCLNTGGFEETEECCEDDPNDPAIVIDKVIKINKKNPL